MYISAKRSEVSSSLETPFLTEGHLEKWWNNNETVSCNDWIKHQAESYYVFPQGDEEEGKGGDEY